MADKHADLILSGGRIFLGREAGFAEALAIRGNEVLAAGSAEALAALAGPATRVVELAGRAAVPGFNDGHQHLLPFGMEQLEVSLHPSEVRSLDALLGRIRDKAASLPPDDWVVGRRYDHFHLDVGRHPTRDELDRAAPDHPVWITRTCGHLGIANSAALVLAGIDETTADPVGGHLERREGRLTGLLQETAQDLVKAVLPKASQARLVEAIEAAGRTFLAHGITSVMDAGVGLRQGWDDLEAYREARRQCRLPLRAYLSLIAGPDGIEQRAFDEGLMTGQGDERLKIGSVKLFTDGSAGGKTAAMTLPYTCSCDNRGLFIYPDAVLEEWVEGYHRKGWQISIHAIGDAAIAQALRAVAHAQEKARDGSGRRHRIEHCGFTDAGQIAEMARLGMVPAPQPIFLYEFGELYREVLGDERPAGAYPMRDWSEAGLRPIASSDTPVSDFDPMKSLYTMVTRRTDQGRVMGAEQALELPEAVAAATANGAYGSFSESVKGTLEPGMLADVAVLERDIFEADPEALLETRVDLTILDGEVAYDRRGETAG